MNEDLTWLAGLLEGEGYFGTINSRVKGKVYRYPRVGINMTDRDVMERVAKSWGVKLFVMKLAGVSKKVSYRAVVVGARAAALMEQLRPLLGKRRQAQIDVVLEEYGSKEPANAARRRWSSKAASVRSRNRKGQFVGRRSV